jgi:hypothetical protein
LSAIRVVTINYNSEKDGDYVEFEKNKFKFIDNKANSLSKLGIWLSQESAQYSGTQRTAIYIPQEQVLCFKRQFHNDNASTFKRV